MSFPTRWEVEQAARELKPEDLIYLVDGPRQGEGLIAPNHTGRICLGLAAKLRPQLGAELIYEPVKGQKTSEGARCYRYVPPGTLTAD